MLVTLDNLQAGLNIDLTDPNGQTLSTSLVTAATGYLEKALGFPLEERQEVAYFDGPDQCLRPPLGALVSALILATWSDRKSVSGDAASRWSIGPASRITLRRVAGRTMT